MSMYVLLCLTFRVQYVAIYIHTYLYAHTVYPLHLINKVKETPKFLRRELLQSIKYRLLSSCLFNIFTVGMM